MSLLEILFIILGFSSFLAGCALLGWMAGWVLDKIVEAGKE